jgi:hypothetical protein
LYDDRRSLTYTTIAIPNILVVSIIPIVIGQGTHNEFMKLIIRTNVSCPNLDIHKSKEAIAITYESKMGITYYSMVLTTNEVMAC